MIAVEKVRKSFNGTHALDGFTLQVAKGELFGLVGPNGAGKTTLMKILSTLLPVDSGSVQVAGIDVSAHPQEVKRLLGYMPDQPGVYQDMSVREFLEFFAAAFHIPRSRQDEVVDRALARSDLSARSHDAVEQLSFGMKQRLVLAKTLLHDPKVLLLDEPATGLDPMARIELRAQLKQLQAEGITILISSHILSDLEDICTQIAFIGGGRNATDAEGQSVIRLQAPESTEAQVRTYEVEVIGDSTPAVKLAEVLAGTRVIESVTGRLIVEITGSDENVSSLLRALVMGGVNVIRFSPRGLGLEERYQRTFGEKR